MRNSVHLSQPLWAQALTAAAWVVLGPRAALAVYERTTWIELPGARLRYDGREWQTRRRVC